MRASIRGMALFRSDDGIILRAPRQPFLCAPTLPPVIAGDGSVKSSTSLASRGASAKAA